MENTGSAELTLEIAGDSPDFFTAGLAPSINPDSSDDFTISFEPASPGTKTASITITSNDPNEGVYTFLVRGNATRPANEKITSHISFTRPPGGGGAFSGRMDFQSIAGKTYRITTSCDLITFEPIPGLTGIAGTGEMIAADLSAFVPSDLDPTRYFRVEEE